MGVRSHTAGVHRRRQRGRGRAQAGPRTVRRAPSPAGGRACGELQRIGRGCGRALRSAATEKQVVSDATAELEKAVADIPLNRDGRDVLEKATALASERGAPQAGPVDVLEAIFADHGSSAYGALRTLTGNPEAINAGAAREDGGATLPLRQLLVNANREAQVLGHSQVDSRHLLLAVLYTHPRPTP